MFVEGLQAWGGLFPGETATVPHPERHRRGLVPTETDASARGGPRRLGPVSRVREAWRRGHPAVRICSARTVWTNCHHPTPHLSYHTSQSLPPGRAGRHGVTAPLTAALLLYPSVRRVSAPRVSRCVAICIACVPYLSRFQMWQYYFFSCILRCAEISATSTVATCGIIDCID